LAPDEAILRLFFTDADGTQVSPVEVNLEDIAVPTIELSVQYRVADDNTGTSSGNGNKIAEAGEAIDLHLSLVNSGAQKVDMATVQVSAKGCGEARIYSVKPSFVTIDAKGATAVVANLAVPASFEACKVLVHVKDRGGHLLSKRELDLQDSAASSQ
jgi:hypothetical protein